jgi:glycosyltransferase involved in cell wall biosynthesis
MAVLESFACGTPVIGARIGGIPELVQEGVSGYLFDAGDAEQLAQAMQVMLDHPDRVVQMGRQARRQVEADHNPTTHYEQTLALYQRCLNTTGLTQNAG